MSIQLYPHKRFRVWPLSPLARSIRNAVPGTPAPGHGTEDAARKMLPALIPACHKAIDFLLITTAPPELSSIHNKFKTYAHEFKRVSKIVEILALAENSPINRDTELVLLSHICSISGLLVSMLAALHKHDLWLDPDRAAASACEISYLAHRSYPCQIPWAETIPPTFKEPPDEYLHVNFRGVLLHILEQGCFSEIVSVVHMFDRHDVWKTLSWRYNTQDSLNDKLARFIPLFNILVTIADNPHWQYLHRPLPSALEAEAAAIKDPVKRATYRMFIPENSLTEAYDSLFQSTFLPPETLRTPPFLELPPNIDVVGAWFDEITWFRKWMNATPGHNDRLIWFTGSAQSGKTVMAYMLTGVLHARRPQKPNPTKYFVAHLFLHPNGLYDTGDAIHCLAGQLILQMDFPSEALTKLMNLKNSPTFCLAHHQLYAVMQELCAKYPIYIIIDGLDGANQMVADDLINTMMQLGDLVRICCFSRPRSRWRLKPFEYFHFYRVGRPEQQHDTDNSFTIKYPVQLPRNAPVPRASPYMHIAITDTRESSVVFPIHMSPVFESDVSADIWSKLPLARADDEWKETFHRIEISTPNHLLVFRMIGWVTVTERIELFETGILMYGTEGAYMQPKYYEELSMDLIDDTLGVIEVKRGKMRFCNDSARDWATRHFYEFCPEFLRQAASSLRRCVVTPEFTRIAGDIERFKLAHPPPSTEADAQSDLEQVAEEVVHPAGVETVPVNDRAVNENVVRNEGENTGHREMASEEVPLVEDSEQQTHDAHGVHDRGSSSEGTAVSEEVEIAKGFDQLTDVAVPMVQHSVSSERPAVLAG